MDGTIQNNMITLRGEIKSTHSDSLEAIQNGVESVNNYKLEVELSRFFEMGFYSDMQGFKCEHFLPHQMRPSSQNLYISYPGHEY